MVNNFGFPCYEHKIIIPSNTSLIMKKNLPFSLIIFFTVLTGTSFSRTYQSQSLHYKIYCNNNMQKKSVSTFENLMLDKLKNEESCDMNFLFSQMPDQYKKAEVIIVNHVGLAGIVLVRADFEFTKFSGKKSANFHTISVSQKTEG